MKSQIVEKAIAETQECLIRYWKKDYHYAAEKLVQNVLWIGAVDKEFLQGREAVTNDLKETNRTNPVCNLFQQEFWCVAEDKNMCVVAGRYLVTTDNKSGEILQEQQRATFVWSLEGNELKIVHMHISQPIGYLENDEVFPHKIGRMSYEYLQRMAEQYEKKQRIIKVKALNGHIHFLLESEIEYAEAKGHNTIIGLTDGMLTSRMDWKNFLDGLGNDFVKVHRSFVINRRYIKALGAQDIEMWSGMRIPVPVKRRKETYDKITSIFCEQK